MVDLLEGGSRKIAFREMAEYASWNSQDGGFREMADLKMADFARRQNSLKGEICEMAEFARWRNTSDGVIIEIAASARYQFHEIIDFAKCLFA
jgi:hypothetical protein